MNQKLQIILTSCTTVPSGLENRVIIKVKKVARRRFFEKMAIGSIVSVLFAVIFVVVGRETLSEIATSGFGQYLSLIFINGGVVMSNWNDFAWTVVESAPITGLIFCLGTAGLLVGAVRWTGRTFGVWNGANSAVGKLAV